MRNIFFHFSVTFLSFMMIPSLPLIATKANLKEEIDIDHPLAKRTRVIETTVISSCFINILTDDIHLYIFSFLNQRDIPSATRISKKWKRLMENTYLWRGYAQRAFLVMPGQPSHNKNYKALVREHSIPSFMDLGSLNGGKKSYAYGINLDGSVIVGTATDGAEHNQPRAFRWTVTTKMEPLETLNRSAKSSAHGVSFDGSVIVGDFTDQTVKHSKKAFRWTAEKGMEPLETLNDSGESSAHGISFNGSVIVGYVFNEFPKSYVRAMCWTPKKGIESLGNLNGGIRSCAQSANFDGSVVIGYAMDGFAQQRDRAFRWTPEKGMESLGVLNEGVGSRAYGLSFNGSVIVGYSFDGACSNEQRAFRWTPEKGMESLGTLNKGRKSWAHGVSFDGSIIVGQSHNSYQNHLIPFRWTHEKGMESVEKLLSDKGVLPLGWVLIRANAITPSGTMLIGSADYKVQNEKGESETLTRAWRAVIPRSNETVRDFV